MKNKKKKDHIRVNWSCKTTSLWTVKAATASRLVGHRLTKAVGYQTAAHGFDLGKESRDD